MLFAPRPAPNLIKYILFAPGPTGGELPARSGWSFAGPEPLGERQNANFSNGFSKVLKPTGGEDSA